MDLALATAVAPTTMAAERTLPVSSAFSGLLPEGLVRGRTVACQGLAAPSLALGLVAEAMRTGAWLAVVDVPWLGVEAAVELGVPVERVVRVDLQPAVQPAVQPGGRDRWVEVVGAAVEGFELVLTRVPPRLPAGLVRRLQTRIRSRGAVVVTLGLPGSLSGDVTLTGGSVRWEGLGAGHGHLRSRRVTVEASGRRVARPRRSDLWLPAVGGGVDEAGVEPIELHPTHS